jgi:hypothetical protein
MKAQRTLTIRNVTFVQTDPLDMEHRAKALYELFERVKQRRKDQAKDKGLLDSTDINENRLRKAREYECLFEIDRRLDRIEYNLKRVIELFELLAENSRR